MPACQQLVWPALCSHMLCLSCRHPPCLPSTRPAVCRLQRALRKRGGKHGSGLFSSTERPSSGGGGGGAGRQPLARESALSDKSEGLDGLAGQPVLSLRPSATQARLQRGRAAEEESEAVAGGRMTAKQQLLAQAAATPSGLRASKSIGAHLADLMQASRST